jgi:hypothetical protein
MKKLFGTDGIRGVAGQPPLDDRTIYAVGLALAHHLTSTSSSNQPRVLIGMDTRESSESIAATLTAGLTAGRAHTECAGVITTPAIAYLARARGFSAGIVISASHNPWHDNGIKLFGPDGYKLPDSTELAIESEIFARLHPHPLSSRTLSDPELVEGESKGEGSASQPNPAPVSYFEGCLPIEETARRGRDTLRFGPMKPVGLTDPKTGRWPYAVVQLRQENLRADSYNLVGFQNHLKFGEQALVLRLIPGLENASFLRYGQIHRNTYINAPALLTETLQLRAHPSILIAGQLSGVEGYTESIASGLLAGRYAAALARGLTPAPAPRASANGSLIHYITHAESKRFQPANITFDLLPPLEDDLRKKTRDKKERHRIQCERALAAWDDWLES